MTYAEKMNIKVDQAAFTNGSRPIIQYSFLEAEVDDKEVHMRNRIIDSCKDRIVAIWKVKK